MPDNHVSKYDLIINISKKKFDQPENRVHETSLFTCEDETPPKFWNSSCRTCLKRSNDVVKQLCKMQVDLKQLPDGAFQLRSGPHEEYYRVSYTLGVTFGQELVSEFLYLNEVMGRASAKYSI